MLASDVELVCVAIAAMRQIRSEGFNGDVVSGDVDAELLFDRASLALGGVDEIGGFLVVDESEAQASLAAEADFALSIAEAELVRGCVDAASGYWGRDEFEIRTGFDEGRARDSVDRLVASARRKS